MKSDDVNFPKFAYVGCFTSAQRKAHGKGIDVYRIDQSSGDWHRVEVFETADNPSFLALDRRETFLYSVHGDSQNVISYSINRSSGKLAFLNRQPNTGDNSVHVSLSHCNKHLVVANGPGITVFPLNEDGSLAPFSENIVPPGGPGGRHNQTCPHPHQVVFDSTDTFVLAPDHGSDKIHVYKFDASNGKLVTNRFPAVKTRVASAPRHLAFSPKGDIVYTLNELDSTVTAYCWDNTSGELQPFQVITTLPSTFTQDNDASEIAVAPSGRFLYVSNRGHDSIAVFAIEDKNGTLSPIYWEPTQGRMPRFFALDADGRFLYAANLESDNIVVFRINQTTGVLMPTGQIVSTGSPSCVVFTY